LRIDTGGAGTVVWPRAAVYTGVGRLTAAMRASDCAQRKTGCSMRLKLLREEIRIKDPRIASPRHTVGRSTPLEANHSIGVMRETGIPTLS